MAKRSQHSFLKRQKEMKRKDKAAEKMASGTERSCVARAAAGKNSRNRKGSRRRRDSPKPQRRSTRTPEMFVRQALARPAAFSIFIFVILLPLIPTTVRL